MSYTKLTDFASKDALLTGNPSKLLRGTELGAEFDAIEVADALNIKPDNVTAATGKTTPVDADLLTLFDSASTFSLKKLTWANIKATLKTYFDTLYARSGANTDITSLGAVTSINGGPLAGLRNAIINGNFGVNQRAVSGTVTLAAGAYGHDRFKAGASGCTYTFATSLNVTTLTISAGSLQQVIEGVNLQSGTYTLSWAGTAQGKIGGGSYASSGVTGTTTGGTNLTVEFNTGTLSKVQLEFGSVATAFEQRPYGMELALCKRYYHVIRGGPSAADYRGVGMGLAHNSVNVTMDFMLPTPMRIGPTVSASTLYCYDGSTLVTTSAINNYYAGTDSVYITFIVNSGLVTGRCVDVHTWPASTSFLALDAEM